MKHLALLVFCVILAAAFVSWLPRVPCGPRGRGALAECGAIDHDDARAACMTVAIAEYNACVSEE